ncbi:hypothetical protein [Streptomyces hiroshimensis]|uniref:Uncharacterized protein n=1 Tax=Streptomyces hiroshimensis TaxID=66424 RepID=A0ABQ2Y851_9ACTN|nr:hypothetical protein [Streptomyces hiroshimensis]GGX72248.1 hypothetical protein GCM10010324_16900 [Streptomyces hiroshimensis]
MPGYEATAAATALARAQALDSTVRSGSRWFVRYQWLFGCAAAVAVLACGLIDGPAGAIVFAVLWVAAVTTLAVWANRQPVSRHGLGRRHHVMIAAWGLLHAAVITPGTIWFRGDLAWWVPGAVVVALPGLVGAWREGRR